MGAKRQYTAIFAIGAKLLGSFKGAIAAAQSRLKGLEKTALAAGKGILKFGALFSSVFAGIAALGVGAVFKKLFEGADEAATAFENRTRRLTASLMNQNRIGKEGWAFAEAQTAELYKHNEALSKQIGLSKAVLDQMAVGLAVSKFGPQRIAATVGPMANMLLVAKGFGATTEEAGQFAKAFGKAVNTGMIKPLLDFGIVLTDDQQKAFKKAMTPMERYITLMKIAGGKGFAEAAARELQKPAARIQRFYNELEEMQIRVGEAAKPAKAAVADTWRSLLPEMEPMLLGLQNIGTRAMMRFAVFTKNTLLPALKSVAAWAAGPGLAAWNRLKTAWSDMAGKVGKALAEQFHSLAGRGKTLGDVAVAAMDKLGKFFKWIGDNAPMIIRIVEGVALAFVALQAVSFVKGNITMIGFAAAMVALIKVQGEFQKTHDMLAKKPVQVDADEFTKHWYLANQTWREFTINFSEGVYVIQNAWANIQDWFVAQWNELIIEALQLAEKFRGIDWTFGFKGAWEDAVEDFKQNWAYIVASVKGRDKWLGGTGLGAGTTPTPVPREIITQRRLARESVEAQQRGSLLTTPTYTGAEAAKAAALHRIELRQTAMKAAETYKPASKLLTPIAQTSEAFTAQLVPAVTDTTAAFQLLQQSMADQTANIATVTGGFAGGTGAASRSFAGAGGVAAAGVAGGGAPAPPPVPLTPEATAKITAERADILKDLSRPEIRNLVSATLAREMSSAEGQKDVMESLVNRAVAYKRAGKDYSIESLIKGGFYGPWNRGETQATMAKGLSEARSQQVAGFIEEMKTRNALRGMTDQGVNVGQREYHHGEGYSYSHGFGQQYHTAAYLESQKAAREAGGSAVATAHALGGIFRRHHVAHIAERGPEAVIPLTGGSRARGLLAAASRALGVGGMISSPTSVSFAPNITIHGGAGAKEVELLDDKLRDLARDFVAQFTRAQQHERRLSYEGGYG